MRRVRQSTDKRVSQAQSTMTSVREEINLRRLLSYCETELANPDLLANSLLHCRKLETVLVMCAIYPTDGVRQFLAGATERLRKVKAGNSEAYDRVFHGGFF